MSKFIFGNIQSYSCTNIHSYNLNPARRKLKLPLHYSRFPLILIFIFSVLFVSCSGKPVDHEKFINAYVDLRITEDTLKEGGEKIQDLKKEILKKHGITEEQYENTFNYFNKNPELWNAFYDEIIARVDTLRKMNHK